MWPNASARRASPGRTVADAALVLRANSRTPQEEINALYALKTRFPTRAASTLLAAFVMLASQARTVGRV